jgi:hypothetical protein
MPELGDISSFQPRTKSNGKLVKENYSKTDLSVLGTIRF